MGHAARVLVHHSSAPPDPADGAGLFSLEVTRRVVVKIFQQEDLSIAVRYQGAH